MRFDVGIVGYGPVGAVAAAMLAKHGLSVVVIEKDETIYPKPRAFALDHEVMRVMQELGLADELLTQTAPFTPSRYYGAQGQLIKCFATAEPPFPFGFTPAMVFRQPSFEAMLREHIAKLDNVTVMFNTKLASFEQDNEGVSVQVSSAEAIRVSWLIGCDGATSTVRAQSGIQMHDLDFDQAWLVVDVLANQSGLAKLPATSLQLCEPKRPTTYLIGTENHRRWEFALNADEDLRKMEEPQEVWRLLSRWIGPGDATLWRQASYRFHALVAKEWRKGRVFLAGDAAHQQPPFLGQGMCQGIRDVANLVWKLTAVHTGQAPERLLDTYGVERGAHVKALTMTIKSIGELVGERDEAKAQARDAKLLADAGGEVKPQTRASLQPALVGGLLAGDAMSGRLFPQAILANDKRMDDALGRGWRVFLVEDAALAAELLGPCRKLVLGHGAFLEKDAIIVNWFTQHKAIAAIVRPDHYVWGTAASTAELQTKLLALKAQLH